MFLSSPGTYLLSECAVYFGPVVQATINSTSMQNNSATGSGLSAGGAINFVGSAAVATQMVLTLNSVTFDGNDAPTVWPVLFHFALKF